MRKQRRRSQNATHSGARREDDPSSIQTDRPPSITTSYSWTVICSGAGCTYCSAGTTSTSTSAISIAITYATGQLPCWNDATTTTTTHHVRSNTTAIHRDTSTSCIRPAYVHPTRVISSTASTAAICCVHTYSAPNVSPAADGLSIPSNDI